MEDDDEPPTNNTTTNTIINPFPILLFLLLSSQNSLSFADDASIMFKLARSLTPAPSGWSGSNVCNWSGVGCKSGRVTSITLSSKSISGTLPSDLNQLSSLQSLSLQQNNLSGTIPSFANLTNLEQVFLDGNSFSSLAPSFLAGLPNLQSFSMGNNPLAPWTLPESLSELTSLQSFRANNASLYGSVPDIFGSLPSLKEVRLSYNNLTGPLPPSLAGSSIQNLWINNQATGLSGPLYVLGKMKALAQAWVQDNAFTGPIPDLSQCVSLYDLELRENQLTGIVPASLTNLPALKHVSLQNNMFQGPVPIFRKGVNVTLGNTNSFCKTDPGPCDPQVNVLLAVAAALGYPSDLARSWKGNNACDDWSHVTCSAQGKDVTVINFAKQGWTGTISPAFVNLTSLTTLILSGNNLYGTIPDSLTSLKQLQQLDVSNNNLTGQVPKFSSSVTVKTSGNPFLGTDVPTGPAPGSSEYPPSSPSSGGSPGESSGGSSGEKSKSKSSLSTGVLIIIIVAALIVAAGLALLLYLFCIRKRGQGFQDFEKGKGKTPIVKMKQINERATKGPNNKESRPVPFSDGGNAVMPIEVLREATNNFSDENILGEGGFGIVYKGVLQDGTQIAVKRMESNALGTKGLAEFEAEIAVLSRVRHRHLVALLGYCVNGNERMVVYEYMPQGTLGQHLFEWKQNGLPPLSWKKRLVIALDVARGVEYLHSLAQQSFIHRDLKPSNILLGEDMRAKVSDFGLVRNAPDGKYSLETRIAGTFGYLAPEYASTGRVTTKVDVFAFGVVLMEIITGRRALDENLPDEQAHLVPWFRRVIIAKENIRKSIDPSEEPDDEMYESICKVAEIAGHCTSREPNQRPEMGHVVSILLPLVEQWRPALSDDDNLGPELSLPHVVQRWQAGQTSTMSGYNMNSQVHSSAPTTPSYRNDIFEEGR
ncbi:hypothetical protein Ancab_019938 [Ancistrocladus abbreviatus]